MVQKRLSLHSPPSLTATEPQLPCVHLPAEHGLPLPSSQALPSFSAEGLQPITGSQTPTLHWPLNTEQSTGLPLAQLPPLHTPARVQGSLSSHWPPSLPAMFLHVFRASSQTAR